MHALRPLLQQLGSLWLANVLLVSLAIALGVATAYEAQHTTEQAQIRFYQAWWFYGLLVLLAVNALASMLSRWPWTRANFGFVLTHLSLVVVLAGAGVTYLYGVDGQIGLAEGETAQHFYARRQSELVVTDRGTDASAGRRLAQSLTNSFTARSLSPPLEVELEEITVAAEEYLPDARLREAIVASENPADPPALTVALRHQGQAQSVTLLAGQPAALGQLSLGFYQVDSAERWATLTGPAAVGGAHELELEVGGQTYRVPVAAAREGFVPVGATDLSVNVRAQFGQAIVQRGGVVTEGGGDQNPAVQIRLRRGDTEVARTLFARFPMHMHSADALSDVVARYVAGEVPPLAQNIVVYRGPDAQLAVKLAGRGQSAAQSIPAAGGAIELAPGIELVASRVLPHARREQKIERPATLSDPRTPALRLRITHPGGSSTHWLLHNQRMQQRVAGRLIEIAFRRQQRPLDFALQLNRFHIGMYPGTQRPRSYESQITITDPATGRERQGVVTMNAPYTVGGYEFFQSSYDLSGGQRVSYLSVSRDPGRPIVYTGYVGLVAGMLWVLGARLRGRAATTLQPSTAAPSAARTAMPPGSAAARTAN